MLPAHIAVLFLPILVAYVNGNLLKNPGFEQAIIDSDWDCHGRCKLEQDSDAHSGSYSVKVTNRAKSFYTLYQWITLTKNTTYYFECYFKLLNVAPGKMYHQAGVGLQVYYDDGSNSKTPLIHEPKVTTEKGWVKLAGDFMTDLLDYKSQKLYIEIPEASVDYLVDDASLIVLEDNAKWRNQANRRIKEIRQNNVIINFEVPAKYTPSDLVLSVTLTRHGFPFGSAVREDQMNGTDQDSIRYRKCFFENFEYAVFHNAHKWKQVEKVEGVVDHPYGAMEALKEKNIPQRGHCLFYDKPDNVPTWVRERTGEDLWKAVRARLNYTLPRKEYKGVVKEWDVSNEQLHGDFFEEGTNDPNFMVKLFKEIKTYDEGLTLFLNDFYIMRGGRYTQALVNSALWYKSLGAPIGAIGAESHLRGPVTQKNITAMQKRLDILATANLPVWITELDIDGVEDDLQLADMYDDYITLCFSNPIVKGLMLWGFHDVHTGISSAAMFEGDNYKPNKAGRRWQRMLQVRWNTTESFTPTSQKQTFNFRGFHGNYTSVLSFRNGTKIKTKKFLLKEQDKTVNFIVQ